MEREGGGRLLFRIYSTPDFIPRNTPYGQPSVHTGKRLHPATETAGLPSGERLGIFRETVELPVWISGKGSMPVLERRRTGIARERELQLPTCNVREEERRSRAG